MIDLTTFREGMARLGTAVSLITSDGPAGRRGLTASAVCSVTDQPPTLLVCINRYGASHDAILENGVFAVNVLAGEHEPLSGRFADRNLAMEERFFGPQWFAGATGAPLLQGANVAFDCSISAVKEVGTHSVLFGEIKHIQLSQSSSHGLVWFCRSYHHLPLVATAS